MPRRAIRSAATAHHDTWPPRPRGRCHPSPSIDSTGRYTEHVPEFSPSRIMIRRTPPMSHGGRTADDDDVTTTGRTCV